MRKKQPRFARGRSAEHHDADAPLQLLDEAALLRRVDALERPFLLALDCIQDPHNLGACLRAADGAGVDTVILPKDRSAKVNETVRRVACGAAEELAIAQVVNLAQVIQALQQRRNCWVVGAADQADNELHQADLRGPLLLVIGAEGSGLRRLTRERCDQLVRIPMRGALPCLNASVATGICLYEALRQREAAES